MERQKKHMENTQRHRGGKNEWPLRTRNTKQRRNSEPTTRVEEEKKEAANSEHFPKDQGHGDRRGGHATQEKRARGQTCRGEEGKINVLEASCTGHSGGKPASSSRESLTDE